jgi:outer membrane protein OmpA-like peptidoglycan-associated protein
LFEANGGLETKAGSIYGQAGLKIKCVNGDDFVTQVKRYVTGETPFIRGTFSMLGQASEVLSSNPAAKPVVFLQLTYSAGDHLVARSNLKSLNDLKGAGKKVKVALQQGGPHVGFLFDILQAIQLNKDDIQIVFTKDLSGDAGPAALFRKDTSVDACFVITPDMLGLTGGLDQTGSGAEGTVKGAHVLASTQQMSRSIVDVLAVRKDWYAKNQPIIEQITAGYLKACLKIVQMRGEFEKNKKFSPEYKSLLEMTQSVFGKQVCPTLEVDTHGLLLDATFVGLTGNISFFQDPGNLNGFDSKMKAALDLATGWGYAKARCGFEPGNLEYQKIATLAGVPYESPKVTARIKAESLELFPDSNLDDRTLLSFTVHFTANEEEFGKEALDRYGAELQRIAQGASMFGNAVVVIRGHSDPTHTLVTFVKAGMEKGIIQRTGSTGNYRYFLKGEPLDLTQTKNIVAMIQSGDFTGASVNPRDIMQSALNLSSSRAESVRRGIKKYVEAQKLSIDMSQIQPVGVGIMEPVIAKPRNQQEAQQNMRVEFRIIKVPAEAIKSSDFDY